MTFATTSRDLVTQDLRALELDLNDSTSHLSVLRLSTNTTASTEPATAAQTQVLPTIVLVQGSFQTPQVYTKLVQGLVAQGYPTIHPQLGNVDSTNFSQLSLVDDALAIRTELTRQIEYEGKTIVIVMLSYGGLVGSKAITEKLSYAKRQAQGLPGGVIHLFFYAAPTQRGSVGTKRIWRIAQQ